MDGVPGLSESTLDRARISRDPRFDGKFFIAVRTTGIYCRPICPSPTSKKANVRYYATAAAAAAAGYRPCRRCRPEVAPGSPAWLGPSAVVRRALRLIQEGSLDSGTVEDLATRLGIGSRHLDRLFLQHVGVSPVAVAQTRRLHFAKQLLDETDLRIIDIAMAAGFGSVRRFNDAFLNAFGKPPRELRRRPAMEAGAKRSESIELKLAYRPPYDWDHLLSFLARRAIAGVERVDAHGYARTLAVANGHVIVSVRPQPGENALCPEGDWRNSHRVARAGDGGETRIRHLCRSSADCRRAGDGPHAAAAAREATGTACSRCMESVRVRGSGGSRRTRYGRHGQGLGRATRKADRNADRHWCGGTDASVSVAARDPRAVEG